MLFPQFDEETSPQATSQLPQLSKPVGKLSKLILSQPMAKTWFFSSPDQETDVDDIPRPSDDVIKTLEQKYSSIHRELAYIVPQQY